ncbi:MAG TPA: VOC family protein [Anaerolineales bacterium]|jgi:catechol 2,3-dioxygenase-like lactoylglutathione lyase family enzyme|nr:VOC family protein [Anaerolineales bacterium]
MKLNHINLTVIDVQEASDFLVNYFGMRNMGGNKGMGFLTDEKDSWGFVLTLMKATEGTQANYPGTFHIGFFIEGREIVDALNHRLREDGFDVPLPEDTGHSYGFYVKAPGGFTVEVGA